MQLDRSDSVVTQAALVHKDLLDSLVFRVTPEPLDHQDLLELSVLRAQLVRKA